MYCWWVIMLKGVLPIKKKIFLDTRFWNDKSKGSPFLPSHIEKTPTRFAGAKRDLDHHYHHHHHHHHPHHHPPSFPASSARSAILSPSFSISSHWTFICQTPFISSFVQWDFLFNPSPNLSIGMQLRGIFEFKGPNFWFYWITISVGKNPFE